MNIEVLKQQYEMFDMDEAIDLLYLATEPRNKIVMYPEDMGLIVGVIDINDEIELVIRFVDGIKLYNKENFERELEIYYE